MELDASVPEAKFHFPTGPSVLDSVAPEELQQRQSQVQPPGSVTDRHAQTLGSELRGRNGVFIQTSLKFT